MNRIKNTCSANSSIYILFLGHCFLLWLWGYVAIFDYAKWVNRMRYTKWANLTETSHANMRYTKSLTPSPTVANSWPFHASWTQTSKSPSCSATVSQASWAYHDNPMVTNLNMTGVLRYFKPTFYSLLSASVFHLPDSSTISLKYQQWPARVTIRSTSGRAALSWRLKALDL